MVSTATPTFHDGHRCSANFPYRSAPWHHWPASRPQLSIIEDLVFLERFLGADSINKRVSNSPNHQSKMTVGIQMASLGGCGRALAQGWAAGHVHWMCWGHKAGIGHAGMGHWAFGVGSLLQQNTSITKPARFYSFLNPITSNLFHKSLKECLNVLTSKIGPQISLDLWRINQTLKVILDFFKNYKPPRFPIISQISTHFWYKHPS